MILICKYKRHKNQIRKKKQLINQIKSKGKIACANVLSDLYSMGIEHCDTMLMLLAASTEMPKELAFKATEWMMKGFTGS